jgi:predicted alpha/beta hydrolase family esterase
VKRAVLLHGTDGRPDELWLPWVIAQLEKRGYKVYAPLLPNNHTPNRIAYDDFLKDSGWNFEDNIVIGHSAGATTVLNLLAEDWFPKIRAAVLVGTFLNERLLKEVNPEWYDPNQFTNLFLDEYKPEVIGPKADKFIFVHGDNDPYCDIEDARSLCKDLNGSFVTIKSGGHLASSSGITELPQLIGQLDAEHLL